MRSPSQPERVGVIIDVIVNERRDKKVAVVMSSCMRKSREILPPLAAHASLRASGCSWLTSPIRKLSAAP